MMDKRVEQFQLPFFPIVIPFRGNIKRRKESAQLKSNKKNVCEITRKFHEEKEIIQEQTDPNLESRSESKKLSLIYIQKGRNKTRKERFSGNEFN